MADSQRLARKAADLIEIEYEVHGPGHVIRNRRPANPMLPIVHPNRESNLLSRSQLNRGDVDAAFTASAHVIEDTYRTQHIEHLVS